ncbi:MAG: DUF3048 domain-containing protein [Actinomycetota bacterium]
MARPRRIAVAVVILLALMGAAAIIGVLAAMDQDESAGDSPGQTASPEPARAPLTGLRAGEGADLNHPAVAIKVSNVEQARPQAGVDHADVVFVEPIGVSYTRLAAVFHSDLPDLVGPVRSVRPMDAPLLSPLSPVFGHTMGSPWVMDYVESVADLDSLGTLDVQGSDAYIQDDQRPSPDDVFARPRALLELSELDAAPEPYFGYAPDPGSSSAELAGGPGEAVEVPYGPAWRVTWTYDDAAGRYLRDGPWGAHTLVDGTQVSAVNVLVLEVPSETGKIGDGAGAPVPILQLIDNSGSFVALTGGSSVTGNWSKGGIDEPFELRTDSGEALELAPGNTWVELPAPSADVETR